MTYTVEISDLAQSDITTIVRYISQEFLESGTNQKKDVTSRHVLIVGV